MEFERLHGLVAAVHTPMHQDGSLNLDAIESQANHMQAQGISWVFVGGSTGESHSLTLDERIALAQRWSQVCQGSKLGMVVHVGCNCLEDSKSLASHAQKIGADALSALSPSYFKPKSTETLIACCQQIAQAAPKTPFYFYDIPVLTGVQFSMPHFLESASKSIPNLVGLKFTNSDLASYLRCLQLQDGRWDLPWGIDEHLLGALATGAQGAVGSSYNFAAGIYHRVIQAFEAGDLAQARAQQLRSVQLIELLASYGYMGAAKATMEYLGVAVGPPRLPNGSLSDDQKQSLYQSLSELGHYPCT
ncbi:MAG: dihydrodipicolinate synthase family protein [Planctomycetota bacterium]|jgi:N-acetylneuraminate lyase